MSRHENILVIGTEPELLKSNHICDSSRSRRIISAGSLSEAVLATKTQGVDVILLRPPSEDSGEQKAAEILAKQCPETLFVIIRDADTAAGHSVRLPFEVYGYLRKPLCTDEVTRTIENALAYKSLMEAHKASKIALLESEGRLANLVISAMMGISIIQDHTVVYQNPAQRNIFEGRPEPFALEDFGCVHPDDLEKIKKTYKSIMRKETRAADADFRFTLLDQTTEKPVTKWVDCRASTYRHRGRDAILLNMMDITHARELENLVMIKDKMASLGRVAAGIAYEIRNPLTGINSYLFTLGDLTSSDRVNPDNIALMRRITSQIQVASNKIESVIKRVLDFSRPSKPKMEMIRINDAISEAIELSAVAIRKKGIALEQDLQEGMPRCYGDAHLIEQVVLNLINNAANVLKESEGEKKIRVASFVENDRMFVRVADSGPGVPVDLREKIFDPFFTTHADGSGIGLSIAQRIMADHGGTIQVGAGEWGGAEFTIEVPVEKRMHAR